MQDTKPNRIVYVNKETGNWAAGKNGSVREQIRSEDQEIGRTGDQLLEWRICQGYRLLKLLHNVGWDIKYYSDFGK